MGTDTKVFIAYPDDKVLDVVDAVLDYVKPLSKGGPSYYGYDTEVIGVNFKWKLGEGTEDRSLKVISRCSCDNTDVYEGEKIYLILGCWGESKEIMSGLAQHLKEKLECRTWLCLNDSTDDFIELN